MLYHDVAEYVHQDVPHPPFYLQYMLPKGGVMLMYGNAGEMKSFIALWTAFCIATGTPWFDLTTTPGKVLVMNFEISEAGYHDRLVNMNRHFTLELGKFYVASTGAKLLDEDNTFNWFVQEFVNPIDPDVIILDCLAKCFGGDENSNQDLGVFFQKMDILKENRRGIILIHHCNKNLFISDAMNRARGGTRLIGDPDTVVYITKQPVGKQLQFGKTRLCPFVQPAKNIVFNEYAWRSR